MNRAFEMRSSSSALPLSASFPLLGKRRQEALLLDRISKALVMNACLFNIKNIKLSVHTVNTALAFTSNIVDRGFLEKAESELPAAG